MSIAPSIPAGRKTSTTKLLISCGILSSLWYFAINVYVPLYFPGYSQASYTVSELSAIGSPTRSLWVPLAMGYILLFAAFGCGVLQLSGGNRRLRILGILLLAYAIFNLYWPPMHQRGSETSLTDTLHIVWAFVTVSLMLVIMGLGSTVFKKSFRIYTLSSIVLQFFFGILTSLEAPQIPVNGPTPLIGVWERINIGIFLVWVIVFAFRLLQKDSFHHQNKIERQL